MKNEEYMERFLKRIVVAAGKSTLKLFKKTGIKYTKSNPTDVVTEADLMSHRIISASIKKNFPDHGIISEEDKEYKTDSKYVWIIDPIDGTLNFSRGTQLYGVFIALVKDKEPLMGASYMPCTDELYFARKGKGASRNGKRVHCSNVSNFTISYGVTGSVWTKRRKRLNDSIIKMIDKERVWISSIGSFAVSTGYVADGQRDWMISKGGGVWDYAASVIILREAGCKVTNYEGEDWTLDDREMLAANPKLHKEMLKLVKK
jgi:myo-inositol-1(or 4)-monophosphatase